MSGLSRKNEWRTMCFVVEYFTKQRVVGFQEHISNSSWLCRIT